MPKLHLYQVHGVSTVLHGVSTVPRPSGPKYHITLLVMARDRVHAEDVARRDPDVHEVYHSHVVRTIRGAGVRQRHLHE